jgi:predicted nucleic acid-binding protein
MPGVEPVRAAILDASVAVRWIVPEAGTEQAVELLSQPITWIAPRLMVAEVAAALRRKVLGDDLRAEQAIEALGALLAAVADGTVQLAEDETLIGAALALALTSERRVPDCLYLAIAEQEGAALATADRRLEALARARGVVTMFVPSA